MKKEQKSQNRIVGTVHRFSKTVPVFFLSHLYLTSQRDKMRRVPPRLQTD